MANSNFRLWDRNAQLEGLQCFESPVRKIPLGAYVSEAVHQSQIGCDANGTAIFAGGVELGASVAGIAVKRLLEEQDPSILFGVVEKVLGFSLSDGTPEQSARRAVLCGLLSEIGTVFESAGNRLEFSGRDDAEIFSDGVRRCRDAAAAALVETAKLSSAANDETPGGKLREIAADYELGEIEGVLITCVTSDGSVQYQMMGALAEKENIGNAVTIAGELKRRLELISVGLM
jgi:hypothetical protein